MKRAAVVGDRTETNSDIVAWWRSVGIDARLLSAPRSLDVLGAGDFALARIDVRRSLDGLEPGLLDLLRLRRLGVAVLNPPSALLNSHDKLRTARLVAAARIPHPETEHVTLDRPVPRLSPPLVLKPRFGSWGADIVRCDSRAELLDAVDALAERPWFRSQGALAQALVPPAGYDLRVLVACGRVVGAERRISAAGEWRTNVSLGGTMEPALPSARARAMALAAARSVHGDFVGIDLLPTGGGYVVVEVNGAVDFDATYSLPGRNVFSDLAGALGLAARPLPVEAAPTVAAPAAAV